MKMVNLAPALAEFLPHELTLILVAPFIGPKMATYSGLVSWEQ